MEEGITAENGGVTASGENEYIDEFDASFPSVSGNNVDSQETVIGVEDKVEEFPEFPVPEESSSEYGSGTEDDVAGSDSLVPPAKRHSEEGGETKHGSLSNFEISRIAHRLADIMELREEKKNKKSKEEQFF